ncbi:MAG: hypothetical protein ACXWKG_11480 [Limisphaerales bacterium]
MKTKRRIVAEIVYLSQTYGGLMTCSYTDDVNEVVIERKLKALTHVFFGGSIHLIKPVITRHETNDPFHPGQKRIWAMMPPVMVAACFASKPVRDGDGSLLVIAWFQNSTTCLLEDAIRPEIEAVNWEEWAHDWAC